MRSPATGSRRRALPEGRCSTRTRSRSRRVLTRESRSTCLQRSRTRSAGSKWIGVCVHTHMRRCTHAASTSAVSRQAATRAVWRRRSSQVSSRPRRSPTLTADEVRARPPVARERRRRDFRHAQRLAVPLDPGADARWVTVLFAQLVPRRLGEKEKMAHRDGTLLGRRVDRQVELRRRAGVVVRDRERRAEGSGALREHLDRLAAPLAWSVVADRHHQGLCVARSDHDRERVGWAATDCAFERLAHDLIQRRLRALAENLGGGDIELERDPVLVRPGLGERVHRRREAVVTEDDRLEVEREVAELADRRPRPGERLLEHLDRLLGRAEREEAADRVEHQCNTGERLHRAVVQEERYAAAFVLLGPENLLGDLVTLGVVAQSMIASRNAIATACVRVSASSFARICRTWLFTVSWLMKSFVATSAFDIPSASSCRISRSRPVSMSSLSLPGRSPGMSAGST